VDLDLVKYPALILHYSGVLLPWLLLLLRFPAQLTWESYYSTR
jgi:hypothetical protein